MALFRKSLTPFDEYLLMSSKSLKKCPNCLNSECSNHQNCKNTCSKQSFCLDCLNDILTNDTSLISRLRNYSCENITYSYVLRYLNRYASEIYRIFSKTKFIQRKNINMISLGCGPATELIGFQAAYHSATPEGILNYYGYDANNIWSNCQNILSNIYSKIPNVNCYFSTNYIYFSDPLIQNTDLFILNYVISHVHKHVNSTNTYDREKTVTDFLNNTITPIFDRMPSGSILLINDTNSWNLGRNQIENWANSQSSKVTSLVKCIYPNPKYSNAKFNTGNHIMSDVDLVFPKISAYANFSISINSCGSAFVILKKK